MQRCGELVVRDSRATIKVCQDRLRVHVMRTIAQAALGAKLAVMAALVSGLVVRPSWADPVDDVIERGMASVMRGEHATYVDYLFAEAAQRDPVALYILGSMLEHGTFGTKDLSRAAQFYSHAADLGFAKAQIAVGDLYAKTNDSKAKAIDWYLKAAAQNDAEAQRKLGVAYMLGQDVPRDIDKAIAWLTRAARRDDRIAKRFLGHIYRNGIDVPKSPAEALEWYYRAAQDGDDVAQYFYGQMAADGEATLQNFEEARTWLLKSARQGNSKAMLALGILFLGENDHPGQRDPVQAYRWLSRAAESGSREAADRKAALAAGMTAGQLRAAEGGNAVPLIRADAESHHAGRQ